MVVQSLAAERPPSSTTRPGPFFRESIASFCEVWYNSAASVLNLINLPTHIISAQKTVPVETQERPEGVMSTDWASFEELVTQVLTAKGFVAELTKRTSDGGIDVIARREESLLRGKYVVWCKNRSDLIGVSMVRDLYGAMTHERASKGILITTSSFTQAAVEFAKGMPLELIDGEQCRKIVNEIGPSQLPEIAATSPAQIVEGVLSAVDNLAVWARHWMRELNDLHEKEPVISANYDVASEEYWTEYRDMALEGISDFRDTRSEALQCAELLKEAMHRWSALIEGGHTSDLREESRQLQLYKHRIARYQGLFKRALDTYLTFRKMPPHPSLTNCHRDALEGMYYGLSALLSLLISTPAKEYVGKTAHMTVQAPQELVDYYFQKHQQSIGSALDGLNEVSKMSRNQWLVIAVLGVAVMIVFSSLGALLLMSLR